MQRNDREKVFRRCYYTLGVFGLVLVVGMIVQSIATGTDPSPRWQLLYGCLFIAFGVQLIVYKDEATEIFQEQYDRFWEGIPLTSFYYDPLFTAGMGVVCCMIGGVGLIKGIWAEIG